MLFAIVSVQHITDRQAGISAGDRNSAERVLLWAGKSQRLNTNLWGLLARDLGDSFCRLLVLQSSGLYGSSEAPCNHSQVLQQTLMVSARRRTCWMQTLCEHFTVWLLCVPQLWKRHKPSSTLLQTTLQHEALETQVPFYPTVLKNSCFPRQWDQILFFIFN